MRKALIGLALTTAMVAAPAAARDGAWYAGVEGGLVFGSNFDVDYDANADGTIQEGEQNLVRFHNKTGWEAGLIFGRDFGGFRLEGEGAYKRIGVDRVTSAPGFDLNPGTGTVENEFGVDGRLSVKSLMANALLDLGRDGGPQVFAGGGVGYGWFNLRGDLESVPGTFVDDSDGGLAWQLLAGLRVPLNDNIDLGLKYRFFNVENLNFLSPGGDRFDTDFRSHSILGSLIFNFGAAPPPPPPPPPAPPPPAPPAPPPPPEMRTCPDGSRVPVTQPCPVPPPPPVQPSGERG